MGDIDRPLRVISVAHTAVNQAAGRLRYHPFASDPTLDVHLVVPSRWYQFGRWSQADETADPGVELHALPIRLPKAGPASWYLHHYPSLASLVTKTRPDVVHLWEEPWSIVALQACVLAKRSRSALVMEVDQNILKRLPYPFQTIRRYVLARTDLVLARSEDAAEVVRACGYTGPTAMIGYGVDEKVFFPATVPKPAPLPLRIGYVGRIIEEKGLDDVLVAMSVTAAVVQLTIVGEGPHLGHLQAKVARAGLAARVEFRPWANPADVAGLLREQHALILPTRETRAVKEQFGRVIIEAQACGTPVIGAATGAIPSVIGRGGWIVPERDPDAMARLFERLSQNAAEIEGCRQAGIDNVAARFTYAAVARDLATGWRMAADIYDKRRQDFPMSVGTRLSARRATIVNTADMGRST